MFKNLPASKPDAILEVMRLFAEDAREGKIDLGVGVYRDSAGRTPVMRAVKAAEARLVETQESKGYVGLTGDAAYNQAMGELILGDVVPAERIAASAATGGTGAVRMAMELVRAANPGAQIWISTPTWPNHTVLAAAVGLKVQSYRYYNRAEGVLDRQGMLDDLAQAQKGDVVLLHGCCHNPTGADPSEQDWADIAGFLQERGLVPFVDIAYQGFGEGLDADAAGLRHLASRLERVIVAASAAKNFGLYRERAGLCLVTCPEDERATVTTALGTINRSTVSFPPDHGARVVQTILDDPGLRLDWQEELETMRRRVQSLREALAGALRAETGSDRFGFLAAQKGMFSVLDADGAQIERLRDEHGIYMVPGGRMNVAGLTEDSVPRVAAALGRVLAG
ncbi:MAG: aspartate/tyrosine/aromatic aminotransferase [Pararhodobacter sp.]|nr:aspartate/tyrosine/aromatic aminotransferase [Pararhodobacter sp.]